MNVRAHRWCVWFCDGELSFGWLQEEHGNGRLSKFEGNEQEAKEKADSEEKHDQGGYCYVAIDLDAPTEEQAKLVDEVRKRARARQRARWA